MSRRRTWPITPARSTTKFSPISARARFGAISAARAEIDSMAKTSRAFVCQSCGAVSPRWAGQCTSCGAWNSIVEEAASPPGAPSLVAIKGGKRRAVKFETLQAESEDAPRVRTGLGEFDRVTGGGLVPGSAILVGGDPGIGKSTLFLQAAG